MMKKAVIGIESARMLRMSMDGAYVFPDDAASRTYYALYHACWAFLQVQNPPVRFDEQPDYEGEPNSYAHNKLEEKLLRFPAFAAAAGGDWRKVLSRALRHRIQADYRYEPVASWMVAEAVDKVGRIIKGLAGLV
jgi:hypothetical protein